MMRPFAGFMGALVPIFGKYVLMSAWVEELRSREGIVMNRCVVFPAQSVTNSVSVAISCAVSPGATLEGTTGFAEVTAPGTHVGSVLGLSVKPEKSPV